MRVNRHVGLLGLLLVLDAGCRCVSGTGEEARKTFELSGFDTVRSDGLFDVHITIGPSFSVVAVADSNILPMVKVAQTGQTLSIDAHGGISPEINPRVEVTMPALHELHVEHSDAEVRGLRGGELEVSNDFMSEVVLEGSVDRLELDAEDDVNAVRLSMQDAEVHLSRSGTHVMLGVVSGQLSAGGRGKLSYAGSPTAVEIGKGVVVP